MEPAQPARQEVTEDKPTGPWIRYRVEHRRLETNELMNHRDSEEPDLDDKLDDDGPQRAAFTLVTTYKVRRPLLSENQHFAARPTIASPPLYSLHFASPAIIHALRSVVQYYPSQDLTGDIVITWPYAILVHHYDELTQYRNMVSQKDPNDLCEREKGADEDLSLLLQYLDRSIMPEVRKERERNERGFYTFEYFWLSMRPGATCLRKYDSGSQHPHPWVIHALTRGAFEYPPVPWTLYCWQMRYDGRYLGRFLEETCVNKWDGESEITNIIVGDLDSDVDMPEAVSNQLEYGKTYWNLLQKQCRHVKGKTRAIIPKEVSIDTNCNE